MTRGPRPTLTDRQLEQIVRWRAGGMHYKEIARRVGCTPAQAIRCWRTSKLYKPQPNLAASAKRREAEKAVARREKRRRAIAQREAPAAAEALRREIAQAVREQATAPRFKPGPLDWYA